MIFEGDACFLHQQGPVKVSRSKRNVMRSKKVFSFLKGVPCQVVWCMGWYPRFFNLCMGWSGWRPSALSWIPLLLQHDPTLGEWHVEWDVSVFYHQEWQLLVGLYWFNHQKNWGYIKGYSQLNVEIGDDSKLVITIFGMLSSTMTPVVWVHWCPNFEPIPMLYPQASFF